MKYVKTLGLTTVAVAGLMAFVGASSASATVFCRVEGTGPPTGTTCPSGAAYPAGTTIEAKLVSGTKFILKASFKTIECPKSTIKGEINTEEGEPLSGPEGTFTLTECNCEMLVLKAGLTGTNWISGSHNGTETFSGAETTVRCNTIFGIVHCIYTPEFTDVGTLTGGNPAKLDVNTVYPKLPTSGVCAETSDVTAEYEVTSPKPLYVAGHT